jgi:hypothetical protein
MISFYVIPAQAGIHLSSLLQAKRGNPREIEKEVLRNNCISDYFVLACLVI